MGFSMPSLSGSCSVFLMLLCAYSWAPVADLLGRPVGAVGEDVADALAADDAGRAASRTAPRCPPGMPGKSLVGQDARLEQLDGEGHGLRRGEGVDAVLGGLLGDAQAEVQVGERAHRVGELGEALHHVRAHPRVDGDGRAALHRAVVAAEQPRPHRLHRVRPLASGSRRSRSPCGGRARCPRRSSRCATSRRGPPSPAASRGPARIGITPWIGFSLRCLMYCQRLVAELHELRRAGRC